jgi:hypothetical protein
MSLAPLMAAPLAWSRAPGAVGRMRVEFELLHVAVLFRQWKHHGTGPNDHAICMGPEPGRRVTRSGPIILAGV